MPKETISAITSAENTPRLISELPLVSIVIPVYNVEHYLCECLDSVIHQTYKNLEIILIDDGSTDSSGSICDKYAKEDERFLVIHKENAGQGIARNIGIDLAHGKYIIFLDSDDYWSLDTVEKLCQLAERDTLQLLLFSAEPFWDGMEKPQHYSYDYSHSVQNDIIRNGPESLQTALQNHEYYTAPVLRFYLLTYLKENRFSFDEGFIHEDECFGVVTYLSCERVECIGERLYKRRFRPGSSVTASTLQASAEGYARALNSLIEFDGSTQLTESEHQLCIRYMMKLLSLFFWDYCRVVQEERISRPYSFRASRELNKKVKSTLKKARFLNEYLPISIRVSTYNLFAAYCISRLGSSMKKAFSRVQNQNRHNQGD